MNYQEIHSESDYLHFKKFYFLFLCVFIGSILKFIISCNIFRNGRSTLTAEIRKTQEIPAVLETIMAWSENSEFLDSLNLKIEKFNLPTCCQEVAKKELFNLDILNEAISSDQKSDIWQKERKLRITGTTALYFEKFNHKNFSRY